MTRARVALDLLEGHGLVPETVEQCAELCAALMERLSVFSVEYAIGSLDWHGRAEYMDSASRAIHVQATHHGPRSSRRALMVIDLTDMSEAE